MTSQLFLIQVVADLKLLQQCSLPKVVHNKTLLILDQKYKAPDYYLMLQQSVYDQESPAVLLAKSV